MAKKSSRKIKVNMEGVQNFTPPPEADYKIGIAEVTQEKGSESGEPYLAWVFEIAEGKQKGKKLFYNTSLQEKALWNLRGLLEAFGIEVEDSIMELDLDEIQSSDAVAGCTVEHEKYNGKPQARIVDFHSADDIAGEEDDEEGESEDGSGVSREDILGLDEDELKEFVEENKLEVDLDDYKKLKAKREAVADAYEAKGGDDDDGDEKPDADAIGEMDEDELQKVIDKFDLDVDLDDHKKLKAKRAAVIEALEGGEEAEEEEAEEEEAEEEEGDDKVTEEAIGEMGKKELAAFVKEHKLKGVELEGNTSKQRRSVIKAAKKAGLIEEAEEEDDE